MSNGFALKTLLVTLALVGCAKKPSADEPSASSDSAPAAAPAPVVAAAPSPIVEARNLYKMRCAVCHGDSGTGDGPGAAALTPKPRNYTDAAWQGSVTDEQISKTILYGGAAVGKSPIMPGNPDLSDKNDVVAELVKIVRSFKK